MTSRLPYNAVEDLILATMGRFHDRGPGNFDTKGYATARRAVIEASGWGYEEFQVEADARLAEARRLLLEQGFRVQA